MALPIIGAAINGFQKIMGQFRMTPKEKSDAEAQLMELQASLTTELVHYEAKKYEESSKTIRAEVASGSWLAVNWRPITMLTFLVMLVSHWYGIGDTRALSDPQVVGLMEIIKIGLGGYVIGRSAEKIIPKLKR